MARKSFSRLKHVLDLPNLIDIQKASFDWFIAEGLRETIDDISPIEDYTGTLAVEFADYRFGEPQFSIQECREKDLAFQALQQRVRYGVDTTEYDIQQMMVGWFKDQGLVSDSPPMVSAMENAGNPHYRIPDQCFDDGRCSRGARRCQAAGNAG